MAFGHPGKPVALTYIVLAVAGAAVGLFADALWLRILGFAAACYAAFCFAITGSWTAFPSRRPMNVHMEDESSRRVEPEKTSTRTESATPSSQSRLPT